jgi:hypothetical protein
MLPRPPTTIGDALDEDDPLAVLPGVDVAEVVPLEFDLLLLLQAATSNASDPATANAAYRFGRPAQRARVCLTKSYFMLLSPSSREIPIYGGFTLDKIAKFREMLHLAARWRPI